VEELDILLLPGDENRLALPAPEVRISLARYLRQHPLSAGGTAPAVGEQALVSIRAAAVVVGDSADAAAGPNSARCEIVFVEFLGDLIKLHLTAGGERMLAKVSGDRYPDLRGREGETIRISWKEEDVQLLHS